MTQVTLRPMTTAEYDQWRPGAVTSYADDAVRAGSMPADQARAMAEQQFTDLLPDGPDTPQHHLLVPELNGEPIGLLWVRVPVDPDSAPAFVCNIEVDQSMRGRGLGRTVMIAGEDYARERGSTSIRLHVFGDNAVARQLYESLGFAVTDVMMAKPLNRTV